MIRRYRIPSFISDSLLPPWWRVFLFESSVHISSGPVELVLASGDDALAY